jgi:hypothetical protein
MLGEKIAEETITTTGRRVLSIDGEPVIETSATATGKLFGVDYQTMVTYTGRLRADGIIAGEGRGVLMGKGGEHATFTAQGVGKFTQNGGVSWRGMSFIQSAHPKWSRVNGIPAAWEYELDAQGNGHGTLHEWK